MIAAIKALPLRYLLLAALVIGLAIGAGSAWTWQANSYQSQLDSQAKSFETAKREASDKHAGLLAAALTAKTDAEAKLRQQDETYTRKLNDEKAENKRLGDLLATGGSVRVQGSCKPSADRPSVPDGATTASLGDAGTVELAAGAGRNVLDIRAGIIQDQAALAFLQQYVNEYCPIAK